MQVNTSNLVLKGSSIDTDGVGGNIFVDTENLISLDDVPSVSKETGIAISGENLTFDSLDEAVTDIMIENEDISFAEAADILEARGFLVERDKVIDNSEVVGSSISSSKPARQAGNAGNINLYSDFLRLNNQGNINTNAEGIGSGGNINITTQNILLNNGTISSSTTAGERFVETGEIIEDEFGEFPEIVREEVSNQGQFGGDISLNIAENLALRNNSSITALAEDEGNGGNININSQFIIAFPEGNNDIVADANQGDGGNININAESLFGIQERPLNNSTNDINASSEFSLDGTVTINTPDINPVQGATELPTNVIVPEETSQQACEINREVEVKNGLSITGRGGIPAEPGLPLDSLNVTINNKANLTSTIPQPIKTSQGKIQPARGISVTESGEVILTAYRTNNAGERLSEVKRDCSRVKVSRYLLAQ